jgi:hypothetical protein
MGSSQSLTPREQNQYRSTDHFTLENEMKNALATTKDDGFYYQYRKARLEMISACNSPLVRFTSFHHDQCLLAEMNFVNRRVEAIRNNIFVQVFDDSINKNME